MYENIKLNLVHPTQVFLYRLLHCLLVLGMKNMGLRTSKYRVTLCIYP